MSRARAAAGFTLVELLVAMTVLALITVGTAGSLGFLGRAWGRQEQRVAEQAARADGLDLLRDQLARALPADWGATGDYAPPFTGESGRVRFLNVPPDHHPGDGLALWEFALEERDGWRALLVRRATWVRDGRGLEQLDEAPARVLAALPADSRFTFHGVTGEDGEEREPGWQESWRSQPRLPDLVRLAGAGIEALVPLRIDSPAACANPRGEQPAGCAQ